MLRVIIIDDENSALSLMRHKLNKHFSEQIEIVASINNAEEGIEMLKSVDCDLLFLDVEMPNINGLEVLGALPERKFEVIFTTAYPQYAIAALRNAAFDYLVKPIDESELRKAIERVLEKKYTMPASKPVDMTVFAQTLMKAQLSVHKLGVPTIEGLLLIPVSDIIRLEGSGSYATIFTSDKQKIVASKNLSEFEVLLSAYPNFFRTHKSHLINLNHVNKYMRGEGGSVIMSDGSEVEVARRRKEDLLGLL